MLMVGAKVLFNSAKMLKMGVLAVFMHSGTKRPYA